MKLDDLKAIACIILILLVLSIIIFWQFAGWLAFLVGIVVSACCEEIYKVKDY